MLATFVAIETYVHCLAAVRVYVCACA